MNNFSPEAEQIMIERFGKDTIVALATTENETPYVRYVNAYYENGAFYIITYALSNKMKHIKDNPVVAIAGQWFTAHGKGVSLGYFSFSLSNSTGGFELIFRPPFSFYKLKDPSSSQTVKYPEDKIPPTLHVKWYLCVS